MEAMCVMQGVAEAECRRGGDVAEAAYAKAFSEGVGPEEGVLDAEHLRCMGIAHQAYADIAVGALLGLHTLSSTQPADNRLA